MKKRYVLGFLIDAGHTVLIRKNRPKWQAGLVNGVGGHIEKHEAELDAMVREFREETGRTITDWNKFAVMGSESEGWEVTCFWAYGTLSKCRSTTDEQVEIHNIEDLSFYRNPGLPKQFIENLPWLFAMIESQKRDNVQYYNIQYVR